MLSSWRSLRPWRFTPNFPVLVGISFTYVSYKGYAPMPDFLTTGRLKFRVMTAEDLDFIAEMVCDAEVMRFYPKVLDRSGAEDWLDRMLNRQAQDGYSLWHISDKTTGEPIGQVGLLKQEVEGVSEVEMGYMLRRGFWRQGYAHEAACAVRDYAFNDLGLRRVISLIRPVNIPSQRVALSYGAKPEKLVTWRDYEHLVFALQGTART
jgi:[ribosomal protein S5]-alanine N-acetyltransferase